MLSIQSAFPENTAVPGNDILDALLQKVGNGDSSALGNLYHFVAPSVYAFALSVLKDAHDAEDILHDSFLRIYSSAKGYTSHGKPMAWILTITKNLCLQKIRDQKKYADNALNEQHAVSFTPSLDAEDKIVLNKCLNLLTDQEHQIVVLHVVAGLKHREIAKLLAMPLPTVLSKYNRSIKKLKQYL